MKLLDTAEIINKLDDKTKNAILALIDVKTENEMEKVLNKLDAIENKIDSNFKINQHSIKLLFWFVGAIGILISVLRFVKL